VSELDRRALLQAGAAGLATALAGCTGMPNDAVFAVDPPVDAGQGTPTPDSEGGTVHVVDAADLSEAEYRVAETAVSEGAVHSCDPDEALSELIGRFGTGADGSYLRFDGDHYPVYARSADAVYAYTADAPDGYDCGLL
jgi:hypothetical protein